MSQKNAIEWVRYSFPTPAHPCYQIITALRIDPDADWKVQEVRANGRRCRDYWIYNEGQTAQILLLLITFREGVVQKEIF